MSSSSLAGRPSTERITVQSLLELVREGRVRVPSFQRALRWKLEDAELLIDSIVRGYPIGTLLLWRHEAQAEAVRLGSVTIEVPGRSDALWVVDGQQRITAMTNVLLSPDYDVEARRTFMLEWELKADCVVRASVPETPDSIRIPLERVVDAADLNEWTLGRGLSREAARQVFELGRLVREYEILAYIIKTDDEQVLRRVFARSNTSGKRLRADEVFNALHGGQPETATNDLTSLNATLMPIGFGVVGQTWLHQAVLAVVNIDATRSQRDHTIPDGAIALSCEPLRRAITFLMEDAQIPLASLLPYGLVLPVLASFFHHHPSPNQRSRALLSRWVWRGAVTGAHRGDVIPVRRKNLQAIVPEDEEASVQNLLALVPARSQPLASSGRFNAKDAAARLWMIVLASFGPRDLITGDPTDLGSLLEKEWRKLPTILQPGSEQTLSNLPELVANRLLSFATTHDLLEVFQNNPALREAHCIDEEVMVALQRGNNHAAVVARSHVLQARADGLIAQRTRWGEPDRPSIGYLVRDDVA
jgi:hypothetical protein